MRCHGPCGRDLSFREFYFYKRDGRARICKKCKQEKDKARYLRTKAARSAPPLG